MNITTPHARPASIRDVARLAGVSTQSVSRVANGSDSVSPELRAKVIKAMKELGYQPNRAARTLRLGRSRTIGLMVDYLGNSGSRLMLDSVLKAATARGYGLTLIPRDFADHGELRRSAPFVAGLDIDGLAVNAGGELADEIRELFPGVPVVALGTLDQLGEGWSSVDMDQGLISRLAVDHLVALGHRRIVHIGGDDASPVARERARGYVDAMQARGLEALPIEYAGWWAADGYRVGELLLDNGTLAQATAVYAANDTLAMGVIEALRDHGWAVPQRVSVVGVDDSVGGFYAHNELTTVRQRYDEAGDAVMRLLVEGRGDGDLAQDHRRVLIGSDIVQRSSTMAPSAVR